MAACPFQYKYTDEHTGKKSRHFATSLEGAIEGRTHGPPPEDEAVEGDDSGDDVDDGSCGGSGVGDADGHEDQASVG